MASKSSSRSLKSFIREVERDSRRGSVYAAILTQRLTSADLTRMQMDEANDLARRQSDHAPRDVRER